ncbi:UNVERIFIED_CONTAM: hypothetical protein Scaly_2872800 [Sesamum calycinum]|uniref:Uncharacterized protein n=1 Tax=Sesamum calycinum TaxID=2727403 RepID=A0AAW2LC01_9LAMI
MEEGKSPYLEHEFILQSASHKANRSETPLSFLSLLFVHLRLQNLPFGLVLFFKAFVHDSAASLSKSLCRDHESAAIEGVVPEPAGRITFVVRRATVKLARKVFIFLRYLTSKAGIGFCHKPEFMSEGYLELARLEKASPQKGIRKNDYLDYVSKNRDSLNNSGQSLVYEFTVRVNDLEREQRHFPNPVDDVP